MSSPSSSSASSSEDKTYSKNIGVTTDVSDFSVNEDGMILYSRANDMTWAIIGASIGRPKREVWKRYKTVKEFYDKMGVDANKIGESWAQKWRADGNEIPTPKNPLHRKAWSNNNNSEGIAQKERDKNRGRSGDTKGSMKKKHGPSKVLANPKTSRKENPMKAKKIVSIASSSSSSSSEGSSPSSRDSSTDSEEERERQKRHIYHHVYGNLYPNQRTFKADNFWAEDDCKILAVIEAKHDELKWKYIQAEFYNATGRMVPVELIKYKMGAKD